MREFISPEVSPRRRGFSIRYAQSQKPELAPPAKYAGPTSIEAKTNHAHPSHPRPAASAQARRHGAGLRRSRKRKKISAISPTPNDWRCCLTASSPIATPDASKPGCAPLGCATAKPRSKTSTNAPRVGSTKRCSSSWRPVSLDRRAPQSSCHRSPGVGKSWLSCALAQKACRDGYTVHARVYRACSPISISPTATVASPGCSACWSRSICSCSMIGDLIASPPAIGAISWRSRRTVTAVAPS